MRLYDHLKKFSKSELQLLMLQSEVPFQKKMTKKELIERTIEEVTKEEYFYNFFNLYFYTVLKITDELVEKGYYKIYKENFFTYTARKSIYFSCIADTLFPTDEFRMLYKKYITKEAKDEFEVSSVANQAVNYCNTVFGVYKFEDVVEIIKNYLNINYRLARNLAKLSLRMNAKYDKNQKLYYSLDIENIEEILNVHDVDKNIIPSYFEFVYYAENMFCKNEYMDKFRKMVAALINEPTAFTCCLSIQYDLSQATIPTKIGKYELLEHFLSYPEEDDYFRLLFMDAALLTQCRYNTPDCFSMLQNVAFKSATGFDEDIEREDENKLVC